MGKQAIEGAGRLNGFVMDPDDLYIVGLDGDEGEEHALWDERAKAPVDPEMVANVLLYGILETVVCRKVRAGDDWRIEVIYGRQRVKWARAANAELRAAGKKNLVMVPVLLSKHDEKTQTGMIEAENGPRVIDTMMTKARKAQRLMTRSLMSEKEVAVTMGVSTESVRQWIVLLGLSRKIQGGVERGVLTASAAIALSDLDHAEQDRRIAEAEALGITISTGEARRQRSERSNGRAAKNSDQITRVKPVSPRVMRKLIDHEEFMSTLPPEARFLLKWLSGEAGMDRKVTGLRKVLREVGVIKPEPDANDAAAE